MKMQPTPAPAMIIPENAPFSTAQRAWLSGFLTAALFPDMHAGEPAAATRTPLDRASNDDAPWHDPAMPLDERMKLAETKPLAPKLMAAMAQQDCGQCGYNCAEYANALFEKTEARLNLCAPGGKETARMLKQLAGGLEVAAAPAAAPAVAPPVPEPAALGLSREQPVTARFLGRRLLNGPGSAKKTWHIDIDLSDTGLTYQPGDSLGVFARNDEGLADQIIAMLGVLHTTPVNGRSLREALIQDVSLGIAPDALFELLSYVTGGKLREKARALARGEDPDGDAAQLDVLGVLLKFAPVRLHPEAFVDALEPLQPRLYSISSSSKAIPGRVSLTVDTVRYMVRKRERLGVASTFLGERIGARETLRVYRQTAHNFALPPDPATPIIMVGPGTGIAPFRAFLQERQAVKARGKSWLFFGHQHEASDFFYRNEMEALQHEAVLSRLSLAWSRDGSEKFYVQDRMRQVGGALWQWLSEGAHIYICGDAKRMAKDVEAAFVDIVAEHGGMPVNDAVIFIGQLKKAARYQADVY